MLRETAQIQAKGGIPIDKKDRTKLKTPGGIFLMLFRQNKNIKKKTKRMIIKSNRKQKKEEKRITKLEESFTLG